VYGCAGASYTSASEPISTTLPRHISGAASDSYIKKYGALGLVAELPYWTDAAAGDTTPTDRVYRDLLLAHAADLRATTAVLDETLSAVSADLVSGSPFIRASRCFIPLVAGNAATDHGRAAAPENDRPATVAEVASCREVLHSVRLRFGGMLLRALEGELAIGNGTPAVRAWAGRLAETYDGWCAEAEASAANETIPIRHLVAIQYGAVLAGATHATETTPAVVAGIAGTSVVTARAGGRRVTRRRATGGTTRVARHAG
jgi:hypothetical protein